MGEGAHFAPTKHSSGAQYKKTKNQKDSKGLVLWRGPGQSPGCEVKMHFFEKKTCMKIDKRVTGRTFRETTEEFRDWMTI